MRLFGQRCWMGALLGALALVAVACTAQAPAAKEEEGEQPSVIGLATPTPTPTPDPNATPRERLLAALLAERDATRSDNALVYYIQAQERVEAFAAAQEGSGQQKDLQQEVARLIRVGAQQKKLTLPPAVAGDPEMVAEAEHAAASCVSLIMADLKEAQQHLPGDQFVFELLGLMKMADHARQLDAAVSGGLEGARTLGAVVSLTAAGELGRMAQRGGAGEDALMIAARALAQEEQKYGDVKVGDQSGRAQALAALRVGQVQVALARHALANEGELPADLEALTPTLLQQVPIDPLNGRPLRLVKDPRAAGGYTLASGELQG